MISSENLQSLISADVVDVDGDKIGKAGQIYVDPTTGQPNWATVRTGFFGTSETFVPLDEATVEGETIRVPFPKDFVKDAPRVEADGSLEQTDENALYAYYNGGAATDAVPNTTDTFSGAGTDTSGPETDSAMTRSEEQLHVGTEKVESGRARLRKYVVTEDQTVTVPVTHEEVRLEREPITEANAGDALSGADISEEEHEVVLTEERVIVSKETVPVERVRVGTETITENQQVNEQVRKEQIEFDDGSTRSN
ncbi:PRC and DUF2382 domain-containing protein [soil metagenome]